MQRALPTGRLAVAGDLAAAALGADDGRAASFACRPLRAVDVGHEAGGGSGRSVVYCRRFN